ncbi:MAG: class I SAM-dependent methyltransferase [Chloroflexota bacterium]
MKQLLFKPKLMAFITGMGVMLVLIGLILLGRNLGFGLASIILGATLMVTAVMFSLFLNLRLHLNMMYKQILSLQSAVALLRVPLRRPVFFLRHAVSPDFVELTAEIIRRAEVKTVLEMGCGASTLYLVSLLPAGQLGGRLVCLESDDAWVQIMTEELGTTASAERASAQVMYAPIVAHSVTATPYYRIGDQLALEQPFELVVVDGPGDVTLRGGVFVHCMQYLSSGAILVFDDGDQIAIRSIISQWIANNPDWSANYYSTVKGTWIVYNRSQLPSLPLP